MSELAWKTKQTCTADYVMYHVAEDGGKHAAYRSVAGVRMNAAVV